MGKPWIFSASNTPIESWCKAALYFQTCKRLVTVSGIDDAGLNTALDLLGSSVERMALDIQVVYGAGDSKAHRYVADNILPAWNEVKALAGETSTGLGGLGEPLWIRVVDSGALKTAWKWTWRVGTVLAGLLAFNTCGVPVVKMIKEAVDSLKKLNEDEGEKAIRIAEATMKLAQQRLAAIVQCQAVNAGNPAAMKLCVDSVNNAFEMVEPAGDCGLLDTPTGTGLGGIMGLFSGYIAAEAALRTVE